MDLYVWPGINSEVRQWAKSCIQCQWSEGPPPYICATFSVLYPWGPIFTCSHHPMDMIHTPWPTCMYRSFHPLVRSHSPAWHHSAFVTPWVTIRRFIDYQSPPIVEPSLNPHFSASWLTYLVCSATRTTKFTTASPTAYSGTFPQTTEKHLLQHITARPAVNSQILVKFWSNFGHSVAERVYGTTGTLRLPG